MKVFVTGATGFIGGSVAVALRDAGHKVSGLSRSDAGAKLLGNSGIRPVPGSLDDTDVLIQAATEADAVVHCADSDHAGAATAFIRALAGTGKRFVHTSGSSIVGTPAMGELLEPTYEETAWFEPSPGRAARVALNDRILASIAFGVHPVIIAPSLIYGPGALGGRESMQIPWLIETARRHGVARHLGPGENRWANVHIADLADLYVRVLKGAPAGAFYWAEGGENSMAELCAAINRMIGVNRPPEVMSPEEAAAEWGEGPAINTMGSNSRVRAVRARDELGWSANGPTALHEIEQGHYAKGTP
ncbi:MAG: NAD-dependent epimerase/dehydratase family protein [Pseudomonadota bacterium]